MTTTPVTSPNAPAAVYVPEPRNGFAITALSLGLIGLLFGLIPLTGFLAVGLGALGVIFALSNRGRVKRGRSTAKKMTWAGLTISMLTVAFGIWGMVTVFTAVDQLGRDLEQVGTDLDNYSQCLDKAQTPKQIERCG